MQLPPVEGDGQGCLVGGGGRDHHGDAAVLVLVDPDAGGARVDAGLGQARGGFSDACLDVADLDDRSPGAGEYLADVVERAGGWAAGPAHDGVDVVEGGRIGVTGRSGAARREVNDGVVRHDNLQNERKKWEGPRDARPAGLMTWKVAGPAALGGVLELGGELEGRQRLG